MIRRKNRARKEFENKEGESFLPLNNSRQELKKRLRYCVDIAGSGNALADRSGIPRRTLESYLAGTAEPKASRLAAIIEATGVNGHWLLTGEEWKPSALHESPAEYSPRQLDGLDFIPFYDITAAAGEGGFIDETPPCSHLAFQPDWLRQEIGVSAERLAAIRADGESMTPIIHPGDVLLIDLHDIRAHRDGIYILRLDAALVVKRLQHLPGRRLLVKSEHPAYDPYELRPEEIENGAAAILGRVVWSGRRM